MQKKKKEIGFLFCEEQKKNIFFCTMINIPQ